MNEYGRTDISIFENGRLSEKENKREYVNIFNTKWKNERKKEKKTESMSSDRFVST